LYEPHSVGLHNEFRDFRPNPDTLNPLHGLPIYKPYFMVPSHVRRKFFRVARPKAIYEYVCDAITTVMPFHEMDREVIVQSNQLHPILHEFADYFGCKYIHIVRDVAEVIYSHAETPRKLTFTLQRLALFFTPNLVVKAWERKGKFELGEVLRVARKLGWVDGCSNPLETFVSMYVNCNYHVLENLSKKGRIVRFEDLLDERVLRKTFSWMGLKVDGKLDPRRAFQCPKGLKRKVYGKIRGELRRKWEELGYEVVT